MSVSPAQRPPRPRKLRVALAWPLLGALVPLLLGSTMLLWRQWDLQREGSVNRLKDSALALQLSVDRELALHQTALQVLATSVAIDNRDWAAFHAAATEATKLRLANWVVLGDASRQMLVNTLAPFGTPLPDFLPRDPAEKRQIEWQGGSLPVHDTAVLSERCRRRPRPSVRVATKSPAGSRSKNANRLIASRYADELREVDRRKDEFIAMLGHELRNPLAPISNSLAVMRKLPPGDPAMPRLQDMMERQTRQLSRLVDDLLDVSRINTGKIVLRKERLDLNTVIRQAARVAQAAMDLRRHTFTVMPCTDPLWVDGDEARLAQILDNLLDNAAKYTEPGGKVELSVRREADSAVIRVSDTGSGIRAELLPHVFDLFILHARRLASHAYRRRARRRAPRRQAIGGKARWPGARGKRRCARQRVRGAPAAGGRT